MERSLSTACGALKCPALNPWSLLGLAAAAVLLLTSAIGPATLAARAASATPNALIFTGAPASITAGQHGAFTVQRLDSFGNPVASGSLLVQLKSSQPQQRTFTFLDERVSPLPIIDEDNELVALTIPAGSSAATFLYRPTDDDVGQRITVTAVYNGVAIASVSPEFGVSAAAAAKLAFRALTVDGDDPLLPGSAGLGADIKGMVVEVQDQFRNRNPSAAPTITITSTSTTAVLGSMDLGGSCDYTDQGPGEALTSPADEGQLRICYRDAEKKGVANLTATASGLAEARGWVNITDIAVDLGDLAGPATLTEARLSSPYELTFNAAADRDLILGLIATEGTQRRRSVSFLKTDGTPLRIVSEVTQLPVMGGATMATFAVKDTEPVKAGGSFTIRAVLGLKDGTNANIVQATLDGSTVAEGPHHFGFTTPPQTITAGSASGEIVAELRDSDGNSIQPTGDVVVTLSSTSPAGEFVGATGVSRLDPPLLVLRTGAAPPQVRFTYRDTSATTPLITLSASLAGRTFTGSQQQLIIGGAPAKLAITSPSQAADVGQTTGLITVQLQDDNGVATAPERDTLVALSTTSTGAVFRDVGDSTNVTFVTVAAGRTEAGFRYTDNVMGTATITVEANGLARATQEVAVGGAAPVPALPASVVPPPNTPPPPAFLADIALINVTWAYLGASNPVQQLTLPVMRATPFSTGCWSGPNATTEEAADAVRHGTKPAGTVAIYFFIRGTRAYVLDTSFGNYCWFDLQ